MESGLGLKLGLKLGSGKQKTARGRAVSENAPACGVTFRLGCDRLVEDPDPAPQTAVGIFAGDVGVVRVVFSQYALRILLQLVQA